MIYDFYILTNNGLKNANVESSHDFSCAPFGFVSYRQPSSCDCHPDVLEDFWRCVDDVITSNNLLSSDYIRAVRAYSNGSLYGEYPT